jgi:NitT/TauT family transport system ATP-binding protein
VAEPARANGSAAGAAADTAARHEGAGKGEAINLRDVSVAFGDFVAVEDGSLEVAPGEFVCLLGPSGCGKSTLLNVVAGFVGAARGEVVVGGDPVTGPDVSRGMVFQSSEALFPWLSVRQNVAFGPRMRGLDRDKRGELCDHFLKLVGLTDAAAKRPGELSGGMRQRVQIARVLANRPSVVLMDEPFGALDAQTREVMQRELERIWRNTSPTIVFVTHDITEALLLGDRIITMTAGPAARIKTIYPVELERPRDETDPASIELHRTLRHDIGEEVSKTLRAQGLDTGT